MSVTYLSTPTSVNYSDAELKFEVHGSNHISTPGTHISFKLVVYATVTNGATFAIPMPDATLLYFSFANTPSDTEFQLDVSLTALGIKVQMESFLIIQETYTISVVDSTTIQFTSLEYGSPDIPTPILGSCVSFADFVQGSQPVTHSSYVIGGSVVLPAQNVPVSVDVDSNGDGQIDISTITSGQITVAERLTNVAIILAVGGFETVTLRLAEIIDGISYRTYDESVILIPGNANPDAATLISNGIATTYPDYYELTLTDSFLLSRPYTVGTAKAIFTFNHIDGSETTYTTSILTLADGEIVSLRCGPADITFPDNVVSYFVVFYQGSTAVSPAFLFRIIDPSDYRQQFAYVNSFGCTEIFHADGLKNSSLRIEQELLKFQRIRGRYVTDSQHTFTVDTGIMPTLYIPMLKDFFRSTKHHVYENDIWVPIIITDTDFDLESDSNTMNSSTFTYTYANE